MLYTTDSRTRPDLSDVQPIENLIGVVSHIPYKLCFTAVAHVPKHDMVNESFLFQYNEINMKIGRTFGCFQRYIFQFSCKHGEFGRLRSFNTHPEMGFETVTTQ